MALIPTQPTFGGYSGVTTPAKPTIDLSAIGALDSRAARNAAGALPGAVSALQTLNKIPGQESAALGQSIASLAGNAGNSRAERAANRTALELAMGQANELAKAQAEQKAAKEKEEANKVAQQRHQEMVAATAGRGAATGALAPTTTPAVTSASTPAKTEQPTVTGASGSISRSSGTPSGPTAAGQAYLDNMPSLSGYAPQQLANFNNSKIGFAQGGKIKSCYSQGGKIVGPGTGTSDSIPAKVGKEPLAVSNGEYILPKKVVDAIGVEVLDALVLRLNGKEPGPTMGKDGEMKAETGGLLEKLKTAVLSNANRVGEFYERDLANAKNTMETKGLIPGLIDYGLTAPRTLLGAALPSTMQTYGDVYDVVNQSTVKRPVLKEQTTSPAAQPAAPATQTQQTQQPQQAQTSKVESLAQGVIPARALEGQAEGARTATWRTGGDAAKASIDSGNAPAAGTGLISFTRPDGSVKNVAVGQAEYFRPDGSKTTDYGETQQYKDAVARNRERERNMYLDYSVSNNPQTQAYGKAGLAMLGEQSRLESAAGASQQKMDIEKSLANEQIRKSQNNEVSTSDLVRSIEALSKMDTIGATPEEQAANRKYVATIQQHILGKLPGGGAKKPSASMTDKELLQILRTYKGPNGKSYAEGKSDAELLKEARAKLTVNR